MRKLLIRSGLVVVLILLGIMLFIIGKEHKVFIDNQDLSIDGQTYTAVSTYQVWVDGEQVGRTPLRAGRRSVTYVAGLNHKIELQEIIDGQPVGERIVKEFKLAVKDVEVSINIPALVADSDSFLYPAK